MKTCFDCYDTGIREEEYRTDSGGGTYFTTCTCTVGKKLEETYEERQRSSWKFKYY